METQHPENSFASLGLSSALLEVLSELGYQAPTPIQSLSLPPLLEGRDLIGQSKTGSGKTAAFSLPLLERLDTSRRDVQALVLCPTRELCTQVAREIRKLGRNRRDLQVLILSGGHPIYLQLKTLKHGSQVVVGTPGRVEDHLRRKTLDLSQVTTVVLDEADRMLDMGFREKIEWLLKQTPKERQTALFSATFPSTIEALSRYYQRNPQVVKVEEDGGNATAIEQVFYSAPLEDKESILLRVLQSHPIETALIFCNQKARVDEVHAFLKDEGYSVEKLHGDLVQDDRDRVMAKFRNRSAPLLVATDVAARGIDVKELDAVINCDLPSDPAVYVHRIGRTGRAGHQGLAISLVTEREGAKRERIEAHFQMLIEVRPLSRAAQPASPARAAMETLYISGGRKDKVRPGDILGALTGEAGGLKGDLVGKIEILDRHSYVAVARSHSRLALDRLRQGRIKGRKFQVQLVR